MYNVYPENIKKLLFDMLKEKYKDNELMIERIAALVNSPRDYELLGKLLVSLYETSYMKAVNEQKQMLEKHGIKATVSYPQEIPQGPKIFKK
jgi:hypothetical protein